MSHTQVRADEATTNHEENNYGLFCLSADARTASGSNLLLYAMAGIAIQYKSWKASRTTKRIVKGGKEKPTLLQRLNDSPNRNARTGSYRGKTAPMPMHDAYTWRNPGGPIGSPACNQTAGYATAKSDHAGKHVGTNGRAGCNVRRQHPYTGNKYPAQTTANCQQRKQDTVHKPSLQRSGVHNSGKQEPAQHPRQGKSDKAKKNASGYVLRLPVRRGRKPSLGQWDT